jgi:hypothetical protein
MHAAQLESTLRDVERQWQGQFLTATLRQQQEVSRALVPLFFCNILHRRTS